MNQQALVNNYLEYVQSYEQTIAITESQMEEYLLEMSKGSDKVLKWVVTVEKELKKRYNISFEPIKTLGRKQGTLLRKEFKKGTPPEVLGKKVGKSVRNMMVHQGKQTLQNINDFSIDEKIGLSIMLFIIILFIQQFCLGFILAFATKRTADLIVGLVIAPLVEEASKTFFIKKGMPWVGTGIVYGIEAAMFIKQILKLGGKIGPAIILRGAALMMHFATTYIQKQIIEKNQADESQALYIAWVVGVCIHTTYNIIMAVNGDQIGAALSK